MRGMLSFASYFVEPFISNRIHCFIFMVPNTPVKFTSLHIFSFVLGKPSADFQLERFSKLLPLVTFLFSPCDKCV